MNLAEVRERLEGSRAALLAALEGVTERDFATELEHGTTIVATLAALAPAEREAIRQARLAVGAPERALPAAGAKVSARATPPQVVHDLAGARYETSLFLEFLGALPSESGSDGLETLLEGIYEREIAVAEAVQSRIGAEKRDPA